MVRLVLILFTLTFYFFSCQPGGGLFGGKSLHEQYGQKLKNASLDQTALGKQWFQAAEDALSAPQTITLPYKEVGYFPAEKPRAAGLKFSAKRGEKLVFNFDQNPDTAFRVFVELWRVNESGAPDLILGADSAKTIFEQEADEDETYILRMQPELLKSGDYTLSISVGPSLDFPVPRGRIGSFWGADRDAGARRHEGIDIFAPKRTPTIAAADGVITSVREGGIGGKVIFMRPSGKNYSLYYAHLDEQLVTSGESVNAGDTIGLVGNTGNARSTPPHLHFGIYTYGGAINPLPFVNPAVKKPADVRLSPERLAEPLRSTTPIKTSNKFYSANSIVFPLAASSNHYRVELPDKGFAVVSASEVQSVETVLQQGKTKGDSFLLESPQEISARKALVKAATPVKILGYFTDYVFVEAANQKGWLPSSLL